MIFSGKTMHIKHRGYISLFQKNMNCISYFSKLLKPLPQISQENPKQLIAKINQSRKSWAKLQQKEKNSILLKFYENLSKNKQELAYTITKSTGKQLASSVQEVHNGLSLIKKQLQQKYVKRVIVQQKGYGSGYYDLLPYGSILQIVNHHSPFFTSCKYLMSALITNNSLLFHANKLTFPLSYKIESIWKQTCENQQNILLVKNFQIYEEGKKSPNFDKLITINDIGFISFTGDVSDGNSFYHEMAVTNQNFPQSQFLLQGCDSCHILQDLKNKPQKLKTCAKIIAKGAFSNGGTMPHSIKRLFIHTQMLNEFLPYIIQETNAYKFQFQKINKSKVSAILRSEYIKAKKYLKQLQKLPQQFKILAGGIAQKQVTSQEINKQDFVIFEPVIIQVLTQYPTFPYQSKIYPAPILFIHPSNSLNQAIQLINSSIFGISHTIFTQDKAIINDITKIGQKLQVGTINVNSWQLSCDLPISPRKRSGKGYSNGLDSSNITRSKSVTF